MLSSQRTRSAARFVVLMLCGPWSIGAAPLDRAFASPELFRTKAHLDCRALCLRRGVWSGGRGTIEAVWLQAVQEETREACMERCATQKGIFIHVPKAGGGTATTVLRGCKAIRVLEGTHLVTVPEVLDGRFGPGRAMLVLRDPTERLVSFYNMESSLEQNCMHSRLILCTPISSHGARRKITATHTARRSPASLQQLFCAQA